MTNAEIKTPSLNIHVLPAEDAKSEKAVQDLTKEFVGPALKSSDVVQCCPAIMMRRPVSGFVPNTQAWADNSFMSHDTSMGEDVIQKQALEEFDAMKEKLVKAGVKVFCFDYTAEDDTPDAIFCNNWFSTHDANHTKLNKRVMFIHPMKVENRRREKKAEIIREVGQHYDHVFDLSSFEGEGQALEGTGSMIFDRTNRVVYANESERATTKVFQSFANAIGYTGVMFRAANKEGVPIYHTNVIMSIGKTLAIICLEAVHEGDRERVKKAISSTHKVLEISFEQVGSFCGNVIEVGTESGGTLMAMSSTAFDGFTPEQKTKILEHTDAIVHSPMKTIEKIGGGSTRCCIGELFHTVSEGQKRSASEEDEHDDKRTKQS